jgi:molybdenum cofactor synthesis domain-containing protein
MKLIRTEDAAGQVLCHDITQIIPGEFKGARFRKGHIIQPEDIPVLLSIGKENLYVWEKKPGILHEDEAAALLYKAAAGKNIHGTEPKEGKIELIADCDGLLKINREALLAVNRTPQMMIATIHSDLPVKKGQKLAGTRIIPLVIEQEKMDAMQAAAGSEPILNVLPMQAKKFAVITTGSEVFKGRIEDKFTPILVGKLAEYGCEMTFHKVCDDDPAGITTAILEAKEAGCELIFTTGGMSVDPDDRTPLAIRNTGADIVTYGAPVLPGAMFLVSYLDGVPVCGLPGCVMYAKRTIFDLLRQQDAVCGHGDFPDAGDGFQARHQLVYALAHQRLSAGDADGIDAAPGKQGRQTQELFVGEHGFPLQLFHAVGHTVAAAQVAQIGDGQAQIVDIALGRIKHSRPPPGCSGRSCRQSSRRDGSRPAPCPYRRPYTYRRW